ncbi:hypothetical protein E4314_08255 [Staphylococcus pseudintermedius]|nr:hypothetical protein [Staphylococcus pseudintermedius]EGQ4483882.1 hypothetical protein [Staphylococcus pseudintermedius]
MIFNSIIKLFYLGGIDIKSIDKFKVISNQVLKDLSGGMSRCKWAQITCINDSILVRFGTSDPESACDYMKKNM